ncbi:magnesium transporter [Flavobacteriales bacterium]|nr:magnesium transporter [Flavobacteriales bacterium]MDC1370299.1 magnesium transporter [Flavobacteriales bacterium]MDG1175904.1 magnesium transporter [Flavobacteriales bacterium]
MQFKLTKDFIEEIQELIASDNREAVVNSLNKLHEADIAEILDVVSMEEAKYIFRLLEDERASDVLVELEEDIRLKFLKALSAKEIAEQMDNMDSDDAADIMAEMPEEKQEAVIQQIEDPQQAIDIASLMQYEENTAGAIMGTELICVNENWTTDQCIEEMRIQAEDVQYIYTVYVVDNDKRLTGMLSLKSLLFAKRGTLVKDIYIENVRSVNSDESTEEVASMMQKYDFVALPVLNPDRILIGRITIDDVVDIIQEEAEKDYQMASGISENVESSDSVFALTRARLPWLIVGLVGGVLGAKVIGLFEGQLGQFPEMALFIPLIAAMAGNVGVQSSAIVVQGIASNNIDLSGIVGKLFKEFRVALLNGIVCAILIFLFIFLVDSDLKLGLTVGLSLLAVIIFAGIFGTLVPLLLHKRNIDPALATGPFITTSNDVIGLFLYLYIGYLFYF